MRAHNFSERMDALLVAKMGHITSQIAWMPPLKAKMRTHDFSGSPDALFEARMGTRTLSESLDAP